MALLRFRLCLKRIDVLIVREVEGRFDVIVDRYIAGRARPGPKPAGFGVTWHPQAATMNAVADIKTKPKPNLRAMSIPSSYSSR